MQFAKLFHFATGQLLATLRESDAREEADAPFQLVLETRNALGTSMRLAYGYASEAKRDEEFAALDPAQADGHYARMQTTLLNATAD